MSSAPQDRLRIGLVQINNSFAGQDYLPLSVGLLQAYAQKYAPADLHMEFLSPVYRRGPMDEMLAKLAGADVAGFSSYIWNQNATLSLARRFKEQHPQALVVFGGPQVPNQAEAFLRKYPFIDVAVHGEGEAVFLRILQNARTRDFAAISPISYLTADGAFHHQPANQRIHDLGEIPSPFLTGVFDELIAARKPGDWLGLWETNRGCPFHCTFCEWGASTFNKVFFFDMERLKAELDWFARSKVEFIFCCDANFGQSPRDLQIAQAVVDAKLQHGYPRAFSVQSAKNATERIYTVQKLLNDHGLSKGVLLALQSVNDETLTQIKRKNISLKTYDELQRRFRRDGIATFTDMIIGLPGETYQTFTRGVSRVISNGQHNRIQFINLSILGNADMADPKYRAEHGLESVDSQIINIHGTRDPDASGVDESQELIVATRSMPREDWVKTRVFSWTAALLHFDKLLQLPIVLVNDQTGIAFHEIFEAFTTVDAARYPVLAEIRDHFARRAREVQAGGPEFQHSPEWLNMWWPDDEYMVIRLCTEGRLPAFYAEARDRLTALVAEHGKTIDPQLLADGIALNHRLLKLPLQTEDLELALSHNVWEVYQGALLGQPVPASAGPHAYRIDRHSDTWTSWEDWCRRVIWYCNKKGAYVYKVEPLPVSRPETQAA